MLGDLNGILDGLTELEEKGVQTIDCRRAQFSAQEPIIRLRVICQSWKVMFQAEYSSGSPLRMLVDLRASVEHALGRGKAAEAEVKAAPAAAQSRASRETGCETRSQSNRQWLRQNRLLGGNRARIEGASRRPSRPLRLRSPRPRPALRR